MRRAELGSTSAKKMGARPLLRQLGVTFARGRTELECIVPAWEALARAALEPNPFYEHWMLMPAIEAFAAGRDVSVALVWSGDALAGLFPFERVSRYKGLPASALVSWQHSHTLLCTPLVRAGLERECLHALLDSLDQAMVEFRYIPVAEPFHRALGAVLAERALESIVNHAYERGLLRKNRATISGRLRRQVAKVERSLPGLRHRILEAHDDIGAWIDDFLRIEADGWKGRKGSAMASTPANERYFREIIRTAFRRHQIMGCGLDVGGRAIARRFTFTSEAGSYAFKTTYDESYAEYSPGVLLELDNVRQLDAHPRLEWQDSFTEGNVLAVERMWPDRRGMQTLAAGVGPWGRLATAALPWLRWIKRRIR